MIPRICRRCGAPFNARPYAVRSGQGLYCSRPCKNAGINISHGMSRTRLYRIWTDMKGRCSNPTIRAFPYYGGRGISVCREWADSFEAFRDWALGSGYAGNLTIDRIDNDGPYSPDNCRWATQPQQMANAGLRRGGKTSQYKGVSWCKVTKKWRAQIGPAGPGKYIGVFEDQVEAAKAYDLAAVSRYGEFANVNFR